MSQIGCGSHRRSRALCGLGQPHLRTSGEDIEHTQVRYISSCLSLPQHFLFLHTNKSLSCKYLGSFNHPASPIISFYRQHRYDRQQRLHISNNALPHIRSHGAGTLRHFWYSKAIRTSAAATLALRWRVSAQLGFRPHELEGHRQFSLRPHE